MILRWLCPEGAKLRKKVLRLERALGEEAKLVLQLTQDNKSLKESFYQADQRIKEYEKSSRDKGDVVREYYNRSHADKIEWNKERDSLVEDIAKLDGLVEGLEGNLDRLVEYKEKYLHLMSLPGIDDLIISDKKGK